MTWTSYVSFRTQTAFRWVFAQSGLVIYHHPFICILSGLVLTLVSGIGLINIEFESRGLYLWIPTESEVWHEYNQAIDYFGDFEKYLLMIVSNDNDDNLLTPEYLDIVFEIFETTMNNITTEFDGIEWDFDTLCERKYPSYPYCDALSANIFALWGNNPSYWSTQEDIDTQVEDYQSIVEYYLGGKIYDNSSGLVAGGSTIKFVIALSGTDNDTLIDAEAEFMIAYESYWSDHSTDYSDDDLTIAFFTTNSVNVENQRVVSADTPIFVGSVIAMSVYLALTLGKLGCVTTRIWLGLSSMIVMLCAMIVGVGLGSAFGTDSNLLVVLIPFILLGVGVDDQIIIVETLDLTDYPTSPHENNLDTGDERLSIALKHSGLSISLTSFASCIAFFIGSLSDIPAVHTFCVYAGLCFLANYLLQFIMFVPLLSLDEKRKRQNRNFCLCCIKHSPRPTPYATALSVIPEAEIGQSNINDNGATDTTSATPEPTGDGTVNQVILTDDEPLGIMRYLSVGYVIMNLILPLHRRKLYRIIIICIFILFNILSIISLAWLDSNSNTSKFVPDDSFVLDWNTVNEAGYGDVVQSTTTIIVRNIDFSDSTMRDKIETFIGDVETHSYNGGSVIGVVDTWYWDFIGWLNTTYGIDTNDDDLDLNSTLFYSYLKVFANHTDYKEWDSIIIYDDVDNPTKIEATKWFVWSEKPTVIGDIWPFKTSLDELMDDDLGDSSKGFFYDETFPWAYLDYFIVDLTLANMIYALIGVFSVLVFLMDLKMTLFIVLVVVMIDIDLFGWMVLCKVSLDVVSYIELVMAVGLTVDYVIHLAHAIAAANPIEDTYDERIGIALADMGIGVTKGAMTTMLGVILLAFSQSEVFRVFFYMFCGIVLIAFLHGLLFVPAIIGEIPWLIKGIEEPTEDKPYSLERKISKRIHMSIEIHS